MPDRQGNWELLNRSSDPVGGDPEELDRLVRYYVNLADIITSEGETLKRIGDGDTTEMKGEAAEALRESSRAGAQHLMSTADRYSAVGSALRTYRPALSTARDESLAALREAEDADGQKRSAAALPDPLGSPLAEGSPPPTPDELTQDRDRKQSTARAEDASSAALRRLTSAVSALDEAGKLASRTINGAFEDGLTDSDWYKFVVGFNRFLKALIQAATWIGIALAVLALIFTGVGIIALLGAILTVVSLVASVILAAQGEGDWLAVILGVVAVLTLGFGAVLTKAVTSSKTGALALAKNGAKLKTTEWASKVKSLKAEKLKLTNEAKIFAKPPLVIQGMHGPQIAKISKDIAALGKSPMLPYTKLAAANKVKPEWWQPRAAGWVTASRDKLTVKGWTPQKSLGVDGPGEAAALQKELAAIYQIGGGSIGNGLMYRVSANQFASQAGAVVGVVAFPTGYGTDEERFGPVDDFTGDVMSTPKTLG